MKQRLEELQKIAQSKKPILYEQENIFPQEAKMLLEVYERLKTNQQKEEFLQKPLGQHLKNIWNLIGLDRPKNI